jgi:GTP cyclohydrolase I
MEEMLPAHHDAIERGHYQEAVRDLLKFVGEKPDRDGLIETPERVLKALEFWCSGYNQDPAEILKTFEDEDTEFDEMVFQGGIPFFSLCEHHMVPFFGYAHIAYIPDRKIVGLSKLARLTEIYGRRLQVQERMTNQIADALWNHLAQNVAVVTQARHLCMESRGVQKIGTVTVCTALRGWFKSKPDLRAEFMSLVQTAMGGIKIL